MKKLILTINNDNLKELDKNVFRLNCSIDGINSFAEITIKGNSPMADKQILNYLHDSTIGDEIIIKK